MVCYVMLVLLIYLLERVRSVTEYVVKWAAVGKVAVERFLIELIESNRIKSIYLQLCRLVL